jgi:hypothetical protein
MKPDHAVVSLRPHGKRIGVGVFEIHILLPASRWPRRGARVIERIGRGSAQSTEAPDPLAGVSFSRYFLRCTSSQVVNREHHEQSTHSSSSSNRNRHSLARNEA